MAPWRERVPGKTRSELVIPIRSRKPASSPACCHTCMPGRTVLRGTAGLPSSGATSDESQEPLAALHSVRVRIKQRRPSTAVSVLLELGRAEQRLRFHDRVFIREQMKGMHAERVFHWIDTDKAQAGGIAIIPAAHQMRQRR